MRERIREPIFNIPGVVLLLLAVLTLVHAVRVWLPPEAELQLVAQYASSPRGSAFSSTSAPCSTI